MLYLIQQAKTECNIFELSVKKPDAVTHVDAAAVIGDAVKAFTALYYLAKVSTGETILICNATSVSIDPI